MKKLARDMKECIVNKVTHCNHGTACEIFKNGSTVKSVDTTTCGEFPKIKTVKEPTCYSTIGRELEPK
jgi:hypothetical protein